MIDTSIIVALISGFCTMVGAIWGQYIIAKANKKKTDAERAVKDALLAERLDRLEAKVDDHNGYAKRFEEVAISLAELKTELKLKE